MGAGLRAALRGLGNFRNLGYSYIWTNLAFVALSLPVITAPAAYSALMRIGHLAHTDPSEADLSAFWATFRANLRRSLPWGLANLLFAVINFNNLIAYSTIDTPLVTILETAWFMAAVVWLGMLLYTWPIYYEMSEPTVTGATRNALLMVLKNPLFTLVLLIVITLLSIISTVLIAAWLLLTWGAIAAIANAAVLDRLNIYRTREISTS
jgi:uncharacterized membrane protein YesL